jgi:N-methylhydantoinase A
MLEQTFFREHERTYGYAAETEPTEVVNLRLSAIGAISRPQLRLVAEGGPDSAHAVKGERLVFFSEVGRMASAKVYDRYRLQCGNRISGPAIVEEMDSTAVVHPGYAVTVDRYGNLLIEEAR